MKSPFVYPAVALAAASLILAGCSQAAPAAAPTQAAPAPTKAVAPTQAPAAPTKPAEPAKPAPTVAPTAAPAAKKVDWPEKGKAITIIVPFGTGGGNDIYARLLAPDLERELGTPVQVVNKPGAGTQLGLTELARSKPDGYTLAMTATMTSSLVYLDADRKAGIGRKDFQAVAGMVANAMAVAVKSDGPYKTTKDLMDGAKAAPEKIKIADNGVLSPTQLVTSLLQIAGGVKFASVHFDSGGANALALVGGHTDGSVNGIDVMLPHVKSGAMRLLGLASTTRNKFVPDLQNFPEQGYKDVVVVLAHGLIAPAGTPKEIVDLVSGVVKKTVEKPEFVKRADDLMVVTRYMSPEEYGADWDRVDTQVKPLLDEMKKEQGVK